MMKQKTVSNESTDVCVCCGNPVPEGRMVCPQCEQGTSSCNKMSQDYLDVLLESFVQPDSSVKK
ncbi:MAG: hypothetical protein J6L76_07080 [Clostridia bacterium]|nr:hypothetical protein [Clostridia bacterium]